MSSCLKQSIEGFNRVSASAGSFIYSSVFLLDETVASVMNSSICLAVVMTCVLKSNSPCQDCGQDFWNIHKEIAAGSEVRQPRIVVCGQTEGGRSMLINSFYVWQEYGTNCSLAAQKLPTYNSSNARAERSSTRRAQHPHFISNSKKRFHNT